MTQARDSELARNCVPSRAACEVQQQIHTERLIGQRPNAMDLRAEARRRTELRLQDTEAARVAHRGGRLRTGRISPSARR